MTSQVTVKWRKNTYNFTPNSPKELMEKIQSTTRIPIERQKLLFKGKTLKPSESWTGYKLGLKNMMMLMGTPSEELLKTPEKPTIFIEDLPEEEQYLEEGIPPGLENFGNTCYMAATLQNLFSVKPLVESVKSFHSNLEGHEAIVSSLSKLFRDMETGRPNLLQFIRAFRSIYPQFAETNEKGITKQQDADEAINCLFQSLENVLPGLVRDLFGFNLETRRTCEETGEEQIVNQFSQKLRVNIALGTDFIFQGIEAGLEQEIEKNSNILGHNAIFKEVSRIKELPKYLIVQFVRFYWRTDGRSAKILRRVKFDRKLDLLQFSNERLSKTIITKREEGDSFGMYDLLGVITHNKTQIESGHYIGWVFHGEELYEFDDDDVTKIEPDELLRLQGGGEYHTAYINIYKLHED